MAEVDEIDVVKVKTGQKTAITLDAYSGKTFDSKISKYIIIFLKICFNIKHYYIS